MIKNAVNIMIKSNLAQFYIKFEYSLHATCIKGDSHLMHDCQIINISKENISRERN